MKIIKEQINTYFLIMFMMSVANLLYLHHYFLLTIALEVDCFKSSIIDNLIASLLDVTILLSVIWLATMRRLRISLVITFTITLIWSFCNAFYARFFHQYLTWSSIGQISNLSDATVIKSMIAGFQITDLYYPIMIILFCWIIIRSRHYNIDRKSIRTVLFIWSFCFTLGLSVHSLYFFHPNIGFIYELEKTLFTPQKMDSMWPNWTVFHKGFFRKLVLEQLTRDRIIKLNEEQIQKIEKEFSDYRLRKTARKTPENIKNIIFILVESYLSVTSDLIIDGKEITPNLNRLKHDSTIYYNGHMRPNVSIGESADGQFIYMCGLLPLHSEITTSKAMHNMIWGLPKQLQKVFYNLKSSTIIPTNPSLWDQQAMSDAYGFTKLYSILDYHNEMKDKEKSSFLNDEMIFRYASFKDESNTSPFFTLILTMSMHQPYDSFEKHGFEITNKNLPQKYKNYLNSCHFTDKQIGMYLEKLKNKGLYKNSLIIITADHDARPRYLDMEGKISDDIPIYIINGGFDPSKTWHGECNQLDVYTTILDIMGVDSEWYGLGHTLLNKDYQNSVTEDMQELSENIIYSNFFNTKKIK